MHTRDGDTSEFTARDEWMFVLTDLIALRNVRIEITLAIELGVVGKFAVDCRTDTKTCCTASRLIVGSVPGCAIQIGQTFAFGCGFVRVVHGVAEHLGLRAELRVDLETDGGAIHSSSSYSTHPNLPSLASNENVLFEESRELVRKRF